jgi:hypothetical protein
MAAQIRRIFLGDPLQGLKVRGLHTAVTGDVPPLMGLSCLSKMLTSDLATFWFVAPSSPFSCGLEVFDQKRRPEPRLRRLPQAWIPSRV